MTDSGRFSGRSVYDPARAALQVEQQARILADLESIATDLSPGINQSAPRTIEHKQHDHRTCFYASLIGVRQALLPESAPMNEAYIADQARIAGVIGATGAKTYPENFRNQTEFVRNILGIEIRFIDQRQQSERVQALTHGIHNQGKPVLFGVNHHWIAIDGFNKTGDSVSWIGMDPAIGQRLEDSGNELAADFVLDKLLFSGMPTVVVEGMRRQRPRFQRAFVDAPDRSRFRPAA